MPEKKYIFTLYICGRTHSGELAINNVNAILERYFDGESRLDVVDILENPLLAERQRIIATPTLIRVSPEPVRQIVGDFGNPEKVLASLGVAAEIEAGNRGD